jgi:hypothetical protein
MKESPLRNTPNPTLVSTALVAMFILITIANVTAAPIQFIHTGNGSGSIGAINFSNADFTLISNADTKDRVSFGNTFSLDHDSTSINISGIGSFQMQTGTRTFVAHDFSVVGFSRKGISSSDLFDGPFHAAFRTWNMLGAIGPVTGVGQLIQWDSQSIVTNAGVLRFNNGNSISTFQAIVVPEPSTLALATLSCAGLAFWNWRWRCDWPALHRRTRPRASGGSQRIALR